MLGVGRVEDEDYDREEGNEKVETEAVWRNNHGDGETISRGGETNGVKWGERQVKNGTRRENGIIRRVLSPSDQGVVGNKTPVV